MSEILEKQEMRIIKGTLLPKGEPISLFECGAKQRRTITEGYCIIGVKP